VDSYNNDTSGVMRSALAGAIAAPLADVSPTDVTILGVYSEDEAPASRRMSEPQRRQLQDVVNPLPIVVDYEIELGEMAAERVEQVLSELPDVASSIQDTLNTGAIAQTFTVSDVQVTAEAVTTFSTSSTALQDVLVSDGALHLQGWFAVWQLLVACVFWMPV